MSKFHKKLEKHMSKKGWPRHHIDSTLNILSKAQKTPVVKKVDKFAAWSALVIILFGNFILSVALIPFLLTMPTLVTSIVVMFFGLCFGLLIDLVIADVDHIDRKHYIAAGFFLPIVAVADMILVSRVVIGLSGFIKPVEGFNPLILVTLYLSCFALPHIVRNIHASGMGC